MREREVKRERGECREDKKGRGERRVVVSPWQPSHLPL